VEGVLEDMKQRISNSLVETPMGELEVPVEL
jgi:hypothetical protein